MHVEYVINHAKDRISQICDDCNVQPMISWLITTQYRALATLLETNYLQK